MLELLRDRRGSDDLNSNPLLVSLACAARERVTTLRRADLFGIVVRDLLRGDWKRATTVYSEPKPPLEPAEDALELMAEAAFQLFVDNPTGNSF
ncbi:MAG: hypothetical protein ACRER2_04085 [Methylococcales bacterium]